MRPTYEQLEQERNELAAQVERLQKIPYTKTRDEFMKSWGIEGMPGDKKRLVNAAWDRAEWFFNQQAAALKAQRQMDNIEGMIDNAMIEMQNMHPPMRRSDCKRLILAAMHAQEAGDENS